MHHFFLNLSTIDKIVHTLSEWLDGIIHKLPNIILALFIFVLFWFIGRLLKKTVKRFLFKARMQESIKAIIARTVFLVSIFFGFFLALVALDIDKMITSVLAGAGVAALAIGLALQGTLSNTFSGIVLSFLPNLKIGDWVETNGHAGTIVDINLRSVTVIEPDNNLVVIPNSKIIENPFKNYSLTERSRIVIECGVGYESDLEFVRKITVEAIEANFEQRGVEKVEFFYTEFGDSSINYRLRFWVDVRNRINILTARSEAILIIKKTYNKHNINIPFPIRTLDFGKNKFQSETITVQQKQP